MHFDVSCIMLLILIAYMPPLSLQIVLALLNARMSAKSFKRFSGPVLLPLISLMLSKFSLIVPLVCRPSFLWFDLCCVVTIKVLIKLLNLPFSISLSFISNNLT